MTGRHRMRLERGFLCSVLALSLLAGCDAGPGDGSLLVQRTPIARPTGSSGPVIVLVGTLSGPGAWQGDDAFEGANLAVYSSLNGSIGRDEEPFELVTLDDEGDPARAASLVEEAAASERTIGIVYAGPPAGLPPAHDALEEAGIPAVLCYGDLYSSRRLQPHLFQVSPPTLWQARRLLPYFVRDRGYRTIGLLTRPTEDEDVTASFRAELASLPRARLVVARYGAEAEIPRALEELRARRVEALVLEGSPAELSAGLRALRRMGAAYRTTKLARDRRGKRVRAQGPRPWRPQVGALDSAINESVSAPIPAGTVAAETYARGVHYLPVPSFVSFRRAFKDWWDAAPTGTELRAFEAVQMIAWASARAGAEGDVAAALEDLNGKRWGGLDVSLGPDDHTTVEPADVGLWVVPRPGAAVRERARLPRSLPWVPLARGFSTSGRHTDIPRKDWAYLFRGTYPPGSPGPRPGRARWGVTSSREDAVH